MNQLEYVELAKSKDKTRFNLCDVYRAKDRFIATDGHRMHWFISTPIAEPFFISGEKGLEFPDYSAVLPSAEPLVSIEVHSLDLISKHLKALLALAKASDKMPCVTLTFKDNKLTFTHTNRAGVLGVVEHQTIEQAGSFECSYRLDYLLDALALGLEKRGSVPTIEFRGESAALIVCYNNHDVCGLVMPCRLK